MSRWIFAIVLLMVASAKAQTFYEPVQYQYPLGNGAVFYYGGTDSRVFEAAGRGACRDAMGQRVEHPFIQAYVPVLRVESRSQVYSDCRGGLGYESSILTPDDARNQAYASVPRYFRKGDERGIPLADGSVVVPIRPVAGPGTIEIKPYVRPTKATTSPILIIPKDQLVPTKPSDKTVAADSGRLSVVGGQ